MEKTLQADTLLAEDLNAIKYVMGAVFAQFNGKLDAITSRLENIEQQNKIDITKIPLTND